MVTRREDVRAALSAAFKERFGGERQVIARAPGRVNLIGEHTDYNDGFVLPIATEQCTWAACRRRDDGRVRVWSDPLKRACEWETDDAAIRAAEAKGWRASGLPHWASYIAGVAVMLRRAGIETGGFDLLIHSDVPVGSGLSSSAALEVATALALLDAAGATLPPAEVAALTRRAEHEFAGVPCGVMDQSISLLGRRDTALLLDCRSGAYEHVPLRLAEADRIRALEAERPRSPAELELLALGGEQPSAEPERGERLDYAVVVIDTRVRHELAEGEYALRQAQCREAVEFLRGVHPEVRSLRDASPAMVRGHMAAMPQPAGRRALHVVTENQRVIEAVEALERDDVAGLGPLLAESHRSLRDDYEVSCEELDRVVEICEGTEGVIGARMTGGGFGGCAVAIVRADAIEELTHRLAIGYTAPNGQAANVLQTRPGEGASVEARAAG